MQLVEWIITIPFQAVKFLFLHFLNNVSEVYNIERLNKRDDKECKSEYACLWGMISEFQMNKIFSVQLLVFFGVNVMKSIWHSVKLDPWTGVEVNSNLYNE